MFSLKLTSAEERLSNAYLAVLFLVLPLFVTDSFHNISQSKMYFFYALSALYLIALLLIIFIKKQEIESELALLPGDRLFIAFAAIGICSSVLSGFGPSAVFAYDNRNQGMLSFLFYCALLISLRQYGSFSSSLRFFMLFACAVVCTLGVLNHVHVDPLGYIASIIPEDHPRFSSTIGNINFYGAYCVLFFPVPCYAFLKSGDRKSSLIYGALTVLFLWGLMAARTESAVLGLMAALAVLPLLCGDREFRRFFFTLPGLLTAMLLYSIIANALGAYRLSALTRAMLSPLPFAVIFLVSLLCALLAWRMNARILKRIYAVSFFTLLLLCVTGLVFINLYFAEDIPPAVAQYLVITPDWGSDRGRIWMSMTELWETFSPMEKLFGGGVGCVGRWDIEHRVFADAVSYDAHNEYLHYLMTHGILGLAAYMAFMIYSLWRGIKPGGEARRGYICGCIAYAVQATVNIAQMFTTPLFLILLFLLPREAKDEASLDGRAQKRYFILALCAALSCFITGLLCTVPLS